MGPGAVRYRLWLHNGALSQSKAAQAAARAGLRQQLPATENGHVQAQLDFPLLRCDLS